MRSTILCVLLLLAAENTYAAFVASFNRPSPVNEGDLVTINWSLTQTDNSPKFWRTRKFNVSFGNGAPTATVDQKTFGGPNNSSGVLSGGGSVTTRFDNDGPHPIRLSIPYDYNVFRTGFGWQTFSDQTSQVQQGIEVRNVAPSIVRTRINGDQGSSVTVPEGEVIFSFDASDPGADQLAFEIANNAVGSSLGGVGKTLTSNELVRTYAEGTYQIRFSVTDDDTGTSVTRDLIVENVAPVLTEFPNGLTALLGQPFSFTASATDAGGDILTYAWDIDGNLDFLDFDGATVQHVFQTLGQQTISVRVDDGDSGIATGELPVKVVLGGDFNLDGMVNLADYTVWRDNLSATSESSLNGRGNGDGIVDILDYKIWKSSFGLDESGLTAAARSNLTVPEPSTYLLLMAATVFSYALRPRRLNGASPG